MIKIKVSKTMSNLDAAPLGKFENYIIRMNDYVRYLVGIELNSYVKLLQKDGKELTLLVKRNLPQDKGNYGYVTQRTFDKINLLEQIEKVSRITIGCDPEFVILNANNEFVMANSILRYRDKIGSDGNLGELRPDPSDNPLTVLMNLKRLILGAHEMLNGYKLLAKSAHLEGKKIYSVGFHLHYGVPEGLRRKPYPLIRQILKHISKAMDYFIAIPCMIPERGEDSYRRLYTSYGQCTDFKFNNRLTLEYRVPGGYYLRSPMLSLGLLSLGVVVFGDILMKIKETTKFENLTNIDLRKKLIDIYEIPWHIDTVLKEDKVDIAMSYLDDIQIKVENMLGYDRLKDNIINFFKYITSGYYYINEVIINNWEDRSGYKIHKG